MATLLVTWNIIVLTNRQFETLVLRLKGLLNKIKLAISSVKKVQTNINNKKNLLV